MDPQVTGPEASQADLRMGFDAFIEAARRLEQSYAALKVRADAVDLQLAEANRALDRTLTEREAIFAALPMGLMAFAGDGELTWCNTEAKRLRELTELAGVNVAEAPEGDTSTNGLTVRVQRIDLEDRGKLVLVEDRSRLAHLEGEVDRLDRLAGLSELAHCNKLRICTFIGVFGFDVGSIFALPFFALFDRRFMGRCLSPVP